MDAVKFIEERNRMCKSFGGRCKECPGFDVFEEAPCIFDRESTFDATAQIAIVEEWSAAHPRKTRQSEFLKQCPEAAIDDYGVLRICPCLISTSHRNDRGGCAHTDSNCIDCRREFWMQEVE